MSPGQPLDTQDITAKINARRSAFSNSNMVRMREALRYLSGPKLTLFVNIPFYLHANLPQFPGFIPKPPFAHGIFQFKESGFYTAGIAQGMPELEDPPPHTPPAIIALYHIGSLGTFTQSDKSDFDYWVVIDKTAYSKTRQYALEKKLDRIATHAREKFGQAVTFFILDQADVKQDRFSAFDSPQSQAAPKLFLKEEFYRTFLYIAGKLPLWTILPVPGEDPAYGVTLEKLCAYPSPTPVNRDFIDLGRMKAPGLEDILRGLLFHICKSRSDPVKALIKATMIFSHEYGSPGHADLLCNQIKAAYPNAHIDDYRADPYKILFDRVIVFHQDHDPGHLSLIKNAIFLRLCGYPRVQQPDRGSPKRQLLDRYIRQWNLNPGQVKKLFSYPDWAEEEKRLLELTFVDRLSQMYKQLAAQVNTSDLVQDSVKMQELKLIKNKAAQRLNLPKDKILECSTYLRSRSFQFFLLKEAPGTKIRWQLSAYPADETHAVDLHHNPSLLGIMGWVAENQIYTHAGSSIKFESGLGLFGQGEHPISPEAVYLALQPAKPLSDRVFESPAHWVKLIILLEFSPKNPDQCCRAEFLSLNSWGELFLSGIQGDPNHPETDISPQVAPKINQYPGKEMRLIFFQLGVRKNQDAVFQISQQLEDRFIMEKYRSVTAKRPLLDKL